MSDKKDPNATPNEGAPIPPSGQSPMQSPFPPVPPVPPGAQKKPKRRVPLIPAIAVGAALFVTGGLAGGAIGATAVKVTNQYEMVQGPGGQAGPGSQDGAGGMDGRGGPGGPGGQSGGLPGTQNGQDSQNRQGTDTSEQEDDSEQNQQNAPTNAPQAMPSELSSVPRNEDSDTQAEQREAASAA